jgi:hypothetical protein
MEKHAGSLEPILTAHLLPQIDRLLIEVLRSLEPHDWEAQSIVPQWAGENTSPNWFDTARELAEGWHHQQQIRLAVNHPGIMTPELYHPVLDCFMRALPFTYRDVAADPGTLLQFHISGDCGGTWFLSRQDSSWRLMPDRRKPVASRVIIPQEIAWRVFTKGIGRASAAAQVQIDGDRELGIHVLGMTAIVG